MDPFTQLALNLARLVGYSSTLGTAGYAAYRLYLRVLSEWHRYQHVVKSYDLKRALYEAKVAQARILQLERSDKGTLGGIAFWEKDSDGQPTVVDLDTSRAVLTKGVIQKELRPIYQQLHQLRLLMIAAGSQPKAMADVVQGAVELPPLLLPRHVTPAQLIEGQPVSIYRMPLALMVNEEERQFEVLRGDARSIFHVIVSGRTRMGKSTLVEWMAFLYAIAQEQLEMVLIDVKGAGTFDAFHNCSRLRYPIIKAEGDYFGVMADLEDEMGKRKALYDAYGQEMADAGHPKPGIRSLELWNANHQGDPDAQLRPIFVLVDEATIMFDDPNVVKSLMRLCQMGGKAGIRVVLAGTDFAWNSFPTRARAMLATRFACAVDGSLSGPLLGTRDAENLQYAGEFIARLAGQTKLVHCQGAELTEAEMRLIPRGEAHLSMEDLPPATVMLSQDRPAWQTPEAAAQIVAGFIHQTEQGQERNVTAVALAVLGARGSTKWTWVSHIRKAMEGVSIDELDIDQFVRDAIFAVEGA